MALHIPTLLVVSVFIFFLMSLLTFHAWLRETRERPLAYLGGMMLLAAVGVVLVSLRDTGMDFVPKILGNVVLLLSAGLNWTAMRVFAGRRPHVPGLLAGAGIWLILCVVPAFYQSMPVRVSVYSLLAAAYGVLTLLEFWRSRQQLEVAYMPAVVLTLLHTTYYIVRALIDQGVAMDQALKGYGAGVPLFSFMLFESMLYVIGIAYVTLCMVKERVELRFKAAAFCDALTGIGNRRAFMVNGERMLIECQRRGSPMALLLCDLDHFKRLNDAYGHQTGDQVLVAFSQVLAETLGTKDVYARIGGEEFACLLAATDEQAAVTVAERVRQAFARLPLLEPGLLSVSIGVVSSETRGYDLPRLLSLADEALYDAKHQGRNRVHTVSRSALELQPD
ncbi:diguanylate cyclase (GGDEF) domain-containing protein [Pseudomonas sp. NFPP10]|uniref:GGDEF domain-containing protein n=1 Tax=Pseudomonas TaxID=286 RepID=UPI00088EDB60|nr:MULTISPECIES: GGDEF domain-containing protein [Pseudomonas]ROM16601.1 GGDEF domain-containing protein [Pseudomonas protegens]SDA33651.1 diguanylate cyclase (GGDEF) domain-containing protein [Pseudomonas sp. NFPP12]SEM85566.1 diguanylate cyclase (GGDEF) domain-containing protein [Pseudomonas sp. NFPP10]SFK41316.1 diguanylate cyclase (GGDEF) domain-containing protein [Pseudomonas sp. NFPP08]SFN57236.1 diguanylate cyclase (GGDEF) domain-containing protein [Pseudomonas sp. NFPP05]